MFPISEADRVVSRAMADLGTPGVVVEVEPDEADRLGAFVDDALTAEPTQQGGAS